MSMKSPARKRAFETMKERRMNLRKEALIPATECKVPIPMKPLEQAVAKPKPILYEQQFTSDAFGYLDLKCRRNPYILVNALNGENPDDDKKYRALSVDDERRVKRLLSDIHETDSSLYAPTPTVPDSCVGICYSGGYDSILLMAKAAERGETILPIRLGVNEYMDGMWVLAEYALLLLRRKYKNKICRAITPISHIDYGCNVSGYKIQPALAYSLAFIPDDLRPTIKEIQVGFICKDECNSFLEEFEDLYKAARKFVMPFDNYLTIPIKYPLRKYCKFIITDALKEIGLYDKIPMVTCEGPECTIIGNNHGLIVMVSPCDECMSCHSFERADNYRKGCTIVATFGDGTLPSLDTIENIMLPAEKAPDDIVSCESTATEG